MAKTKLSQTVRRKAITCQLNRRFGPFCEPGRGGDPLFPIGRRAACSGSATMRLDLPTDVNVIHINILLEEGGCKMTLAPLLAAPVGIQVHAFAAFGAFALARLATEFDSRT